MKSISLAFAGVCSLLAASSVLAVPSGFPRQAIVSAVNEAQLTVLAGNTRPEANVANDQGAVEGSMPMQHMLLQLKRTLEWAGFGGTSVSSPIMAGIQALVDQKTKGRWGNPNTGG